MVRVRSLAGIAASVAIVLVLASSLCAMNCVAINDSGMPPCHRHTPSHAKACESSALTATVKAFTAAVEPPVPGAYAEVAQPAIQPAAPGHFIPLSFDGPPSRDILRI
jgi:hypothetical protein